MLGGFGDVGISWCRKWHRAWGMVVAESRAGDAQSPSPTVPWEPGVGFGERETFWEKREDRGQDAGG